MKSSQPGSGPADQAGWRADEEIDRMVSDCGGAGVPVIAVSDGMVLDLP